MLEFFSSYESFTPELLTIRRKYDEFSSVLVECNPRDGEGLKKLKQLIRDDLGFEIDKDFTAFSKERDDDHVLYLVFNCADQKLELSVDLYEASIINQDHTAEEQVLNEPVSEPTDYEKWKDFLDSMNIKYTEEIDKQEERRLIIDDSHLIGGAYVYVRIVFYGHDDEVLGWRKDGFKGIESNE